MRLRRRYADFYLARGRPRGRQPLRTTSDFDGRERERIDKLSYQVESLKILDPFDRQFGHYAIYGWWRVDVDEAFNERGELVLETELCETYGVGDGVWPRALASVSGGGPRNQRRRDWCARD